MHSRGLSQLLAQKHHEEVTESSDLLLRPPVPRPSHSTRFPTHPCCLGRPAERPCVTAAAFSSLSGHLANFFFEGST